MVADGGSRPIFSAAGSTGATLVTAAMAICGEAGAAACWSSALSAIEAEGEDFAAPGAPGMGGSTGRLNAPAADKPATAGDGAGAAIAAPPVWFGMAAVGARSAVLSGSAETAALVSDATTGSSRMGGTAPLAATICCADVASGRLSVALARGWLPRRTPERSLGFDGLAPLPASSRSSSSSACASAVSGLLPFAPASSCRRRRRPPRRPRRRRTWLPSASS